MQQSPSTFQVYNASAGSGKTFTLVKEYLKILLGSDDTFRFQNILAITFTNKAAGEMKERVLKNLRDFSEAVILRTPTDMFRLIKEELGVPDTVLHARAQKVLENILQNYSAFNITTIDSFTYKLIRSFAYDLGLPLNFEVEMDGPRLLEEAVDVLISKIGTDQNLTKTLIDFALLKVDDDKSWDITKELNSFSKILLNENDAKHLKKIAHNTIGDYVELQKQLKKSSKIIELQFVELGQRGIDVIDGLGVKRNDFTYSDLPNFFLKLIKFKNLKVTDLKFEGRLAKQVTSGVFYSKNCKPAIKESIDVVRDELISLYHEAEKLYETAYPKYILGNLIAESLIPLSVLSSINKELQEIKDENNIRLNAEFNQIISEKIKGEPAPFIYERIGEKFKYYFIDEMQDTSVLQWQNLIPLIHNALSQSSSSLLLVGDAKQAIYRWRGGKAEQFIDLASEEGFSENKNPFYVDKKTKNLDANYRSYSEVINFNNSFFQHISKRLQNKDYEKLYEEGNAQKENSKTGGYVQLSFVEKQKEKEERELLFPKKVLETIQNLDVGFKRSDVCVLTRTRKQGVEVANYLSENQVEIVSSETLLLQNSAKVNFIIHFLTVVNQPQNKEARIKVLEFLYEHLNVSVSKHDFYVELVHLKMREFIRKLHDYGVFFELNIFSQNPFYESIEQIIRSFRLTETSDAYLQFFLDFVLEYQQRNNTGISDFIELWEQKKNSLSIVAPEGKNAVRIMTIHKSKGLEFPVIIFPCDLDIYGQQDPKIWYESLDKQDFNGFETTLVTYKKDLKYTGTKGLALFEKRREELELDNFNLLYVALTRAAEQLYIITEKKFTKGEEDLKFYSGLFINYLKSLNGENAWNDDQMEYCFGSSAKVLVKDNENNDGLDKITVNQQEFISTSWNNHDIKIVANASKHWDTEQGEAIAFGNLMHEILAKIKTKNDIEGVLDEFISEGLIELQQQAHIEKILKNIVNHPMLEPYFQQNLTVYNEREIVTKSKEVIIPDRLVFVDKNTVVIIDYKTGKKDKTHEQQIENYGQILQQMEYVVSKKMLVYLDEKIVVEEA